MRLMSRVAVRVTLVALMVSPFLTGGTAYAGFVFGDPTKVPNINSLSGNGQAQISRDGLELYFVSSQSPHDQCTRDIWVSRRSSTHEPWGAPVRLGGTINSTRSDNAPCISPDGLELYFTDGWREVLRLCTPNPNGYGSGDIWVARRASREDDWDAPVNLGEVVNTKYAEDQPCISADGLSLYFASLRPDQYGGSDIFVSTRPTKNDPWEAPVNLGPVINTSAYELDPFMAPDGLSLFFAVGVVTSPPENMRTYIYVSRRATTESPWETPLPFAPVNTPGAVHGRLSFSIEDSTLYFHRGPFLLTDDGFDIWQVKVTPIVDFNSDRIVDLTDLLALVEHWGPTEESLYDIAPFPLGDSVVDAQDLEVLMDYWGHDFGFLAHWKFDEENGQTASDTVGQNKATLFNDPIWRPDGGAVDGALELDGVDDYVLAPFVVDPAQGPFSVFAWIKGGGLGQAIVSQVDGQNWLMADPSQGTLATSLAPKGRIPAPPLVSEAVITDDAWHRVGFVWNGTSRALYADDILVAEDVQGAPVSCLGDLNIGCGHDMALGTFWAGLIDDIRIYNRAARP